VKAWFDRLEGVRKVLVLVLFVVTLIPTVFGAIKGWGEVADWWNDRDKPASEFDRSPHAGLEFWQGEEAAPMVSRDDSGQVVRVVLDPAPFFMRVPAVDEKTAVEVCAWTSDKFFRYEPDPSAGTSADRIPCMRLGRGVADDEYASGRLYLNPEGRNYLIGNRLRQHSSTLDQAFFSRTHTRDGGDAPLTGQKDSIYLLVYIDRNANRNIDYGEFEKVELDF
jgi:hypothetical protein